MPERIPLRPGRTAPEFVEKVLSTFGNNPHGEPNYRLVWSERKQLFFCGEIVEEYIYLTTAAWVLEVWVAPEKDAGSPANWNEFQEATMGPYPKWGTYNYVKHYPEDWEPTENNVRLAAVGVQISKDLDMDQREAAIREARQEKERTQVKHTAEAILESFGSAEFGKTTQAVSGRNNVFRTADDFGRDADRETALPGLPERGGKIVN